MSNTNTPLEIKYEDLKVLVQQGKKKEEIAKHYNLTMAATTRLLQEAKLKIRPLRRPVFKLVGGPDDPNAIHEVSEKDSW